MTAPARQQGGVNEQSFRVLVTSVRDYAIFMLDPRGHVQTWNAGAELIKGYTEREIVGQHVSVFYTPEDRLLQHADDLLARAQREGHALDEGYRVRKDGSRFWASVVVTPLYDDSRKLTGFAKVTRDLSERRRADEQLRRSEERFRLLVEGVKDYAIFMLDPDGHVATWNAGAERIEGYAASEILGQHFSRFYDSEEWEQGARGDALEIAKRTGRYEDEGFRVRKDGSIYWANVVLTCLRSDHGEHLGFVKVTRDLTQQRLAEQERVQLAQAQEALRLRDEFLSIASHELKTPLTTLQLQLQSLQERSGGLGDKLTTKIDRAVRSSDRLRQLVETLLEVSRVASGRFTLRPEPFELCALVQEVVAQSQHGPQGGEVRLELERPIHVVWDRLRIEQALGHLLSNARRHAAGTEITVAVRSQGDDVLLEVSDRGPGLPEHDLARIFERFERAASLRHYGGLGLGLYLTREIADAHGGQVTGYNAPAGGASLVLHLPRELAMQPEHAAKHAANHAAEHAANHAANQEPL